MERHLFGTPQSSGRLQFFLQINEIMFRIKSWSLRIISKKFLIKHLNTIVIQILLRGFLKTSVDQNLPLEAPDGFPDQLIRMAEVGSFG